MTLTLAQMNKPKHNFKPKKKKINYNHPRGKHELEKHHTWKGKTIRGAGTLVLSLK